MKKADIEFHRLGYGGDAVPAINVKVHGRLENVTLPLEQGRVSDDGGETWRNVQTDPEFTLAWVEANLSTDEVQGWWDFACQFNYEAARDDAIEIFADWRIDVYGEGRSGGWLVVCGLPSVESWDAVMVGKWAKLSNFCAAYVADIPWRTLDSIYFNVFLPWQEARDAAQADDAASLLPIEVSV